MTKEESEKETDFWEQEVDRLGNKGENLDEKEVEFLCDWVVDEVKKLDEEIQEYCEACECDPCDCNWGN